MNIAKNLLKKTIASKEEILDLKISLLKFRLQSNKTQAKFIKKKLARVLTLSRFNG